jgi:hypothetical protein
MSEHFFGSNKGFEMLAILGENPLLLDPKDLLLDDALTSLCRNPVCNLVPNLIKSSLKGKIQDQSVSTYVLYSLSVSTLATGI